MADPAVEAQQTFAANEPYKNIALGNPAQTALNAWALASSIKLKRLEYQGKLEQLQNQNDMMNLRLQGMQNREQSRESYLDLATKKFQWDQEKFNQTLTENEQVHRVENALREARMDQITQKADKAEQIKDDTIGWNQYMAQSGAPPGSLEYSLLARQGLGIYPNAAVKLSDINKQQNAIRDSKEKGLQAETDLVLKKAGEDYNLPGGSQFRNAAPFLTPEKALRTFRTLPSDAEKQQGKEPTPAAQGATMRVDAATGLSVPVKWQKDAQGNLIESPNVALRIPPAVPGGEDSYAVIPKDQVTNINQRLVDINKRMANLPPKESIPTDTHGGAIRIFGPGDYEHAPQGVPLYFVDPVTQQETWYQPKQ